METIIDPMQQILTLLISLVVLESYLAPKKNVKSTKPAPKISPVPKINIELDTNKIELSASSGITSITDMALGLFQFTFAEKILGFYNVQMLADKNYNYEIKNKTSNGFTIEFSEEPKDRFRLTVIESHQQGTA